MGIPLDGKSNMGIKNFVYCSTSEIPAEVGVFCDTSRDVKLYTGLDTSFMAAIVTL